MRLSEQLKQDHDSGDFGQALEGYSERSELLEKDAARWRWLTTDCDGNAQDDFIRWLAGVVAPKEDIDAMIDALMTPNVELNGGFAAKGK